MRHRHQTFGFTLIELLILLAILGILIALLLPALSATRARARQAKCLNNLAQLGRMIAVFSEEPGLPALAMGKKKDWAAGGVTSDTVPGSEGAPYSWIAGMLVDMDELTLYESIDYDLGPFDEKNLKSASTIIPHLLCPSYTGDNYSQSDDYETDDNGRSPAVSQYAAMGATTREKLYSKTPDGGMVWGKRVKTFPNGATKTIIVAETREQDYGTWMDGTTTSLFGTMKDEDGDEWPTLNMGGRFEPYLSSDDFGGSEDRQWGPSSEHAGKIMHLFAGYNSMAIYEDIDVDVYKALITRDGDKEDNAQGGRFFEDY